MDIETYSRYIHFYVDDTTPLLRSFLSHTNWQTYLDLGCGDGITLYALNKRGFFTDKTVYAIDLSETRIALARQINPAFRCFVDDACNIQHIAPESIDVLVSIMVIEHVPSDRAMAQQIRKVLKPGGMAYISTIFKRWYGWFFYRVNGRWAIDPTHLREYTDRQLLDVLCEEGFEIVETNKTLQRFPVTDFFFRRLGARRIYEHPFWHALRKALRVPIPGYYNWEIICRKSTPGE